MTDYCIAHPTAALPNPDNCAQFYDCAVQQGEYGGHQRECEYPKLYSVETGTCQHFSRVNCGHRYEPITPCELSFRTIKMGVICNEKVVSFIEGKKNKALVNNSYI